MSISRVTMLACVASLTLSFSALLAQCPVTAQQSECCQKASSKAQPPTQDPTKQKQAANKKANGSNDCCTNPNAKKTACCATKTILTDGPQETGSKRQTADKKTAVTTSTQAGGQLNSTCLISKKRVKGDSPLIAYNGFAIRVCCKGCISKFAKLSSRKKDAWIASLVMPVNKICPVSGRPVPDAAPSITFRGNFAKLCGNKCLATWEKADSKKRAMIFAKCSVAPAKKSVEKSQPAANRKDTPAPCCDRESPCSKCKTK